MPKLSLLCQPSFGPPFEPFSVKRMERIVQRARDSVRFGGRPLRTGSRLALVQFGFGLEERGPMLEFAFATNRMSHLVSSAAKEQRKRQRQTERERGRERALQSFRRQSNSNPSFALALALFGSHFGSVPFPFDSVFGLGRALRERSRELAMEKWPQFGAGVDR